MGNYFSSNNNEYENIEEEFKKLQNTVDKQQNTINKQVAFINILKNKIDTLESIKESIIDDDDDDIKADFELVKKTLDYEYLIFSGGGIKGISYCGTLQILEKLGILYDEEGNLKIKGIGGTSAGSIIAALLAVGYTPTELYETMSNLDFKDFLDDKWGYIRDVYNLAEDYGICPGHFAYKFFGQLIEKKTGDKNYTLKQLYDDKGIVLVINGTNKSTNSPNYFYYNHPRESYQNMPIRKAMRISMGVPILFEPEEYDGDKFCDGGIFDNFMIHIFDGEYPGDPKAKLNLVKPNPKVLGFNILTNSELLGLTVKERKEYDSVIYYLLSFIEGFLIENERRMITPSFWKRTINLITPDYPLSDFGLNESQKNELINIGKDAPIEFFQIKYIDN